MSDDRFLYYIQRERERLNAEREVIRNQQRDLETKLREFDREMEAINAYEVAKTGRAGRGQGGTSGRGQQRARRGSKREALIELIRGGNGLSRGEILERMGIRGDKAGRNVGLERIDRTLQVKPGAARGRQVPPRVAPSAVVKITACVAGSSSHGTS